MNLVRILSLAIATNALFVASVPSLDTEEKVLQVVRVHAGKDDGQSDMFSYSPPAGYKIIDYSISEISKWGDASYTVQLAPDGTLHIPWRVQSRTVRVLGIVVDTKTANLDLDVRIKIKRIQEPPIQPRSSIEVPAHSNESHSPTTPKLSLVAMGILSLGFVVGLLVGRAVFSQKKLNLRLAAGFLGLAFSGAPIAFLPVGSALRFAYPIGLLLGLLGTRIVLARRDFQDNVRSLLALADSIIILVIIFGVAFIVVTHQQ